MKKKKSGKKGWMQGNKNKAVYFSNIKRTGEKRGSFIDNSANGTFLIFFLNSSKTPLFQSNFGEIGKSSNWQNVKDRFHKKGFISFPNKKGGQIPVTINKLQIKTFIEEEFVKFLKEKIVTETLKQIKAYFKDILKKKELESIMAGMYFPSSKEKQRLIKLKLIPILVDLNLDLSEKEKQEFITTLSPHLHKRKIQKELFEKIKEKINVSADNLLEDSSECSLLAMQYFIDVQFQKAIKKSKTHKITDIYRKMLENMHEEYSDKKIRNELEEKYDYRLVEDEESIGKRMGTEIITDKEGKKKISEMKGYFADSWQKKNKHILAIYMIAWANHATKLKTPKKGSNYA